MPPLDANLIFSAEAAFFSFFYFGALIFSRQ